MVSHRPVHPDYEVPGYGPSHDSAYANAAYDGTILDISQVFIQEFEDPPHEVRYGEPAGTAGIDADQTGPGYDYDLADGYNGPFYS